MTEKSKKILWIIVGVLIVAAIGFFAGRSTIKPRIITKTIYEKGEPIIIKKDSLVPVYIKKPVDTTNVILAAIESGNFTDLFPVRDSLIYVSKEDTSAVLLDWASERFYEEKLFDIDTVGTEIVKFKVQYNRLAEIEGIFTPVVKIIENTEIQTKKFAPFVGVGITTMPEATVNVGAFMDDKYGAAVRYEYNWDIKKHALGLEVLYKF